MTDPDFWREVPAVVEREATPPPAEEPFVRIRRLEIFPHPNADALELAGVDGYRAIVQKGVYKTGDYAVYIPEKAVLPEELLHEIGLWGKLSGAGRNRVKPIKLRGSLSEGIVCRPAAMAGIFSSMGFKAPEILEEDILSQDYAQLLGVEKWVPHRPAHFAGNIVNRGNSRILPWIDIPNIKKVMGMFREDEYVIVSEKVHGTHLMCTLDLEADVPGGEFMLSSKGMGKQGWDLEEKEGNVYWQAARKWKLEEWMRDAVQFFTPLSPRRIAIYGEVYGAGIQDLGYGTEVGYRIFDIRMDDTWLSQYSVQRLVLILAQHWEYKVEMVPIVYDGFYNYETIKALAEGSTIVGNGAHLREGLVIRAAYERVQNDGSRAIAKVISEGYLTRKGEQTEFE